MKSKVRGNSLLLAWISSSEVNGPTQSGLLARSLAETLLLYDQYTGSVALEGMNNRLMNHPFYDIGTMVEVY